MIVVPGYYDAKKKELEVERRKQESSGSTAMVAAAQGGTQGGGIKEFQLQNPALKEKLKKINKIDQELRKFDLKKDTLYGETVTVEALKCSECRINEMALEVADKQPSWESRDLLSEQTRHMLYPNKNSKPAESHMPLTQTNPNSDATVGIAILTPTWIRIPREKRQKPMNDYHQQH
nr:hypothetical protein CFP56_48255 [Quercus suber]